MRFCRVVCTGATVAASMPLAGWNTTPGEEAAGPGISIALAPLPQTPRPPRRNVEVDVFVQAGAESVNKGHCADVQACLVCIGCARAMGLRALCNDPQEDAQHHIERGTVALHVSTAAAFRGQTAPTGAPAGGEDVVSEVRRRLHHAPCGARGRHHGLCRKNHEVVAHNRRRSERGQSHGQRCRTPDIWQTLCARRGLGCGGRPGRRTDPRWPTLARSRSARLPFGRAACVRGGAGCRVWVCSG